jgi:hypothetical protein
MTNNEERMTKAMKKQTTQWIVLAALACAAPAAAQEPVAPVAAAPRPVAPAKPLNLADLRHHIYVMEGALSRAVDYGAKVLNREILAVMPGVFMLEGEARARGVHLDGYGVFFDVRVPMMRQSMAWSLSMILDRDDAQTQASINEIRKNMQGVTDPVTRANLESALKKLERQAPAASMTRPGGVSIAADAVLPDASAPVGRGAAEASGVSAVVPAPRPPAPSPGSNVWAKDPNRAYTEAVTRALVDAMIDYSAPMQIGADQWLTVAARDDEGRDSLAPPDPLEEIVTMIYKIKGSDLQEYRQGRIDRDEVRKRVLVTQF